MSHKRYFGFTQPVKLFNASGKFSDCSSSVSWRSTQPEVLYLELYDYSTFFSNSISRLRCLTLQNLN